MACDSVFEKKLDACGCFTFITINFFYELTIHILSVNTTPTAEEQRPVSSPFFWSNEYMYVAHVNVPLNKQTFQVLWLFAAFPDLNLFTELIKHRYS